MKDLEMLELLKMFNESDIEESVGEDFPIVKVSRDYIESKVKQQKMLGCSTKGLDSYNNNANVVDNSINYENI